MCATPPAATVRYWTRSVTCRFSAQPDPSVRTGFGDLSRPVSVLADRSETAQLTHETTNYPRSIVGYGRPHLEKLAATTEALDTTRRRRYEALSAALAVGHPQPAS